MQILLVIIPTLVLLESVLSMALNSLTQQVRLAFAMVKLCVSRPQNTPDASKSCYGEMRLSCNLVRDKAPPTLSEGLRRDLNLNSVAALARKPRP